jgi:hypothetical protein
MKGSPQYPVSLGVGLSGVKSVLDRIGDVASFGRDCDEAEDR